MLRRAPPQSECHIKTLQFDDAQSTEVQWPLHLIPPNKAFPPLDLICSRPEECSHDLAHGLQSLGSELDTDGSMDRHGC
jgi:hypothetical protein